MDEKGKPGQREDWGHEAEADTEDDHETDRDDRSLRGRKLEVSGARRHVGFITSKQVALGIAGIVKSIGVLYTHQMRG